MRRAISAGPRKQSTGKQPRTGNVETDAHDEQSSGANNVGSTLCGVDA